MNLGDQIINFDYPVFEDPNDKVEIKLEGNPAVFFESLEQWNIVREPFPKEMTVRKSLFSMSKRIASE